MVKQGDRVKVDGKESVVTSQWAQGKHKVFALEDGRHVRDLDESNVVKSPSVEVLGGLDDGTISKGLKPGTAKKASDRREIERMPRADEDHEE